MTVLTAAAVLTLASQYGDWDAHWVAWQVTDAGTGNGESSGKTDAFNPAGPYRGLLQVSDANAFRLGYTPEQMFDPRLNIEAAHKLWLERGTAPWPSAVKYQGSKTMTDGWCPFAEHVQGVTTFAPGGNVRVGFCDHAAGGFYSTMQQASFWNNAGVSTHFAVARDGRIAQMVSILDTAWAEGRDARGQPVGPNSPGVTWAPFAQMNHDNPNLYLISTEHEDYELVNGQSHAVPGSQWTEAQYAADLKLKRWCIEEIRRVTHQDLMHWGIDSLAGHHMFDPVNRAECPGRYWRDEYRARLYADLTAQPIQEDDDMFTRFNAIAPRLQQTRPPQAVQLGDFNEPIPEGTKRLRIEVYIDKVLGGAVQVKDADGRYAGQVGWDGARYGVVEVDVSNGGFTIEGAATIAQLGLVAVA